jgi:hypothetical protein
MMDTDLCTRALQISGTAYTQHLRNIVRYFDSIYGPDVASVLRRSPGLAIFHGPVPDPLDVLASSPGPVWFDDTFQDMM